MAKIRRKVSGEKSGTKNVLSSSKIKGAKGQKIFRPDAKQTATLVSVGRLGAANAIRISKALGLSITYMQNGILYKELPDGSKEILMVMNPKKQVKSKSAQSLRKGMVLYAKS